MASLKNPRVGFENVLLAIARPFLPIYLYEDLTRFFCIRFGAKSDVLFLNCPAGLERTAWRAARLTKPVSGERSRRYWCWLRWV